MIDFSDETHFRNYDKVHTIRHINILSLQRSSFQHCLNSTRSAPCVPAYEHESLPGRL